MKTQSGEAGREDQGKKGRLRNCNTHTAFVLQIYTFNNKTGNIQEKQVTASLYGFIVIKA